MDRALIERTIEQTALYKSPIEVIHGEMQMNIENGIYKAVQNVGVVVDKDELLKALLYDREQYEKGYADAREKAIDEFVMEIESEYNNDACPNVTDYLDYKISLRDLFKIAEGMKNGEIN